MTIIHDKKGVEPKDSAYSLTTRQHLVVLLSILAVSFLLTWPLVLNLKSIPGGDSYVFAHSFWWYKQAFVKFVNPFYTNYIFYPEGVNLAFQSGAFGSFLLTLPVTLLFGPTIGVNVALLMTFVLAAWFTFLLAHRLTGSLSAALFAAYAYGFSPFHFLHGVAHLNISSVHCLPAVLYGFHRAFAGRTWRWTIITGVFGGITLMTDQFHTILVAAAGGMAAVWCVLNCRTLGMELRAILGRLLVMVAVAVLMALPYLLSVLQFMGQSAAALKRGIFETGGANAFSGDLLAYLLPPPWHPLFGKLVQGGHQLLENPQQYIGWSVLALTFAAILLCWRTKQPVRILSVVALCTFILSLGATLHLGGQWQWGDGKILKLPYYYLAQSPLFSEIRTPGRFQAALGFSLALLAAYGIAQMRLVFSQAGRVDQYRLLFMGLVALLLVEYLPPRSGFAKGVESPVLESMAADSGIRAVLSLPLSRHSSFAKNGLESPGKAMYYQTIHGKPIPNGLMTRISNDRLDFKNDLLDLIVNSGDIDRAMSNGTDPEYSDAEITMMCREAESLRPAWIELRENLKIDAIVIQNPFSREKWMTRRYIECLTGKKLMFEQQSGIAYLHLN